MGFIFVPHRKQGRLQRAAAAAHRVVSQALDSRAMVLTPDCRKTGTESGQSFDRFGTANGKSPHGPESAADLLGHLQRTDGRRVAVDFGIGIFIRENLEIIFSAKAIRSAQ